MQSALWSSVGAAVTVFELSVQGNQLGRKNNKSDTKREVKYFRGSPPLSRLEFLVSLQPISTCGVHDFFP